MIIRMNVSLLGPVLFAYLSNPDHISGLIRLFPVLKEVFIEYSIHRIASIYAPNFNHVRIVPIMCCVFLIFNRNIN